MPDCQKRISDILLIVGTIRTTTYSVSCLALCSKFTAKQSRWVGTVLPYALNKKWTTAYLKTNENNHFERRKADGSSCD